MPTEENALSPAVTVNPQTDQAWKLGQVQISGSQSGYIIIEGIVGNNIYGDIAIDDLRVSQGQCSVIKFCIFCPFYSAESDFITFYPFETGVNFIRIYNAGKY